MPHGVFLGRVLPPHVITGATTQSVSVHCSTVGQSASYQKVDQLHAVSQQKHVASWLTFGVRCWVADHWLLVHGPAAIQIAQVQMSLTKCSTTVGPCWVPCFLMCFPLFLSRRGSITGPTGI